MTSKIVTEQTIQEIQKRSDAMAADCPNGFDSWESELEQVHADRIILLARIDYLESLTSGADIDWLESK